MKNNFQSNGKGRNQRVWQLLISMLIILTMGIGQMWGDTTYYLQKLDKASGSSPELSGDFYTTAPLNQSVTCTYSMVEYKKAVKLGGNVTGWNGNYYPDRMIRYDCKTTSTDFTVVAYSNGNSKVFYVGDIKENTLGSALSPSTYTSVSATKDDITTKTYSISTTATKPASFYVSVGANSNVFIVQIIAVEKGDPIVKPGEVGYSANFNKGRLVCNTGGVVTYLDDKSFEFNMSSSFKAGYSTEGQLATNNTNYIKFTVNNPCLLNFTTSTTKKYTVSKTKGSTAGSITPVANTAQKIKLESADTYYINPQESGLKFTGISFSPLYTISYNAGEGSGNMNPTNDTLAYEGESVVIPACTFDAPSGKSFDKWVVTGVPAVTELADEGTIASMPTNAVTLTAQWKASVTKYAITKGDHDDGDFTISPATQAEGEKVTLVATPNFRYLFDAWEVVKTEDGSATGIVVDGNGQFDMPAYAVTVNATFAADSRKQILYLTSAETTNDKLYAALNSVVGYNVIVEAPGSQTLTNYDLVVLHESVAGNSTATAVTGAKNAAVPVLNTKSYFYGTTSDANARWGWGKPGSSTQTKGVHLNTSYCNIKSHPLFAGLTPDENDSIIILSSIDGDKKPIQPVVTLNSGKEGYTIANVPNGIAIHELTPAQRGVASGKYLLISVYNKDLNNLNADGQKLFKNAAAYLLDGDASWSPATAPTSPAIEATPSENYTEGNTITLTASATGTSASTTYTWYKGDNWTAASATTPIQAAATDGNVFTKTAAMDDAGTYWCNISNGTGCDVQASVAITVVSASAPTYVITYVSDHGTAPSADNAASVVLAELSADGWAHKGWTANANVSVDAATVEAGTLIANGKTAILASDVTFTAVWKEIFTLQFDSKDGSAVAEQSIEDGGHPTAVEDPTKDGYIFLGWSETNGGAVVADITALTISEDRTLFAKWALDIQLTEIVFSNGFKGWINGSTVTAFYMEGESAPTLVSYAGTNLKVADAVAIVGNEVIATGSDDSEKHYTLTMTAVAPLTTTGVKQTFDGEDEDYVKSAYGWKWHETETSKQKGWAFQKLANDGRIAKGLTREYFFFGPAESATFTWKVAKKNSGDPAVAYVYVDGVLTNTVTSTTDAVVVPLKKTKSIVAFESAQTNGDCGLKDVTLAPWIPVTAVALKEGEDAISSKEIYVGANFTLTAEVSPDNASNKTITWTSSDDAVATVVNGVVTGVAANATPVTITASTVDGVTATCAVTVTAAPEPCETPVITADPASQAYCAGSEPTLTVAANDPSDGGTLHYAWFKAGETDEAVGTDAASYTVEAAGTYYVIVTNKKDGKLDASVTSANAVVTLNVAAAITTQPTNKRDVVAGSEVTLSVVASNATGYQWYSCDDAEKHGAAAIPGAEAANYVFTCNANGFYYCVVGNACGDDITSNVVSVKLEPEGCNTFASKPAAEPYNYEQTGEWTFYNVDSNGADKSTDNVFEDGKNFDDEDVVVANTRRFALKFEKDVESVILYGVGGSDKSFTKVSVSDELKKNTYTELTATATKTDLTSQQHIYTIEDMIIPAGKYAWFELSGSLKFFKICYTTALAEPKLPTLADQELCASAAYEEFDATITNAAACEGTVAYKWYETTDTENPVATTAKFTPSAEGTYYVVVTHSAAGHITRTVQSDELSVAHFDALTLVSNSGDVFQHMGTAATLSVVATGKDVAYVWYTCSNAAGDDAVAIDPAATEASLAIASIEEGERYYKVVISHDCDATTLSHVFKVEGWDELTQVDVTGTTTWDMTNVSANHIELTGDDKNARLLLANIDGVNNTTFNAQALKFEGQHIGRTEGNVKHLAGRYVQFNVTVPGAVFVTFASNGDNARTISINGKKCSRTTSGTAADKYITYALAVEPGSVEIVGYEGESANQYVRISKIEFKAEASHNRSGLNPSNIGTLCWTNNAILGGATLYELAGKNEYNKLVFDEVDENRLVAGKPYIFVPENGNTEIKLYNTDTEAALTQGDLQAVNGMHGTFVNLSSADGVTLWDNYVISKNHYILVDSDNVTLKAFRAYITSLDDIAPAPAQQQNSNGAPRRRIIMGAQGEQVTTGNENIDASETPVKVMIDGQLYILRGEKMYDATGRLVK